MWIKPRKFYMNIVSKKNKQVKRYFYENHRDIFFLYYLEFFVHTIEQMLEFLPQNIKSALQTINARYLYEIRLRAGKPVLINYNGNYAFLGEQGIVSNAYNALSCSLPDIADCIYRAGEYSVYAIEEELKQGFITATGGVRIGIAGQYVFDGGKPLTIRNISSLCIRIPHEIYGAGIEIYNSCMRDRVRNILILSSPGLGKTTILRDLARLIGEKTVKNVLICDERGEIAVGNVGNTCDIIQFADKSTAFSAGIRALRPDIIITDELSSEDCVEVKRAIQAGISVFASAHFSSFAAVQAPFLGLFERYVLLSDIGKIDGIYDKDGEAIL